MCNALPSQNQPSYRDKRLYVDLRQSLVILDDETVRLSRIQYRLLALLVEHAGEVVPRTVIFTQVWDSLPETRSRTLDVHIHGLRKKLGLYADQCIETVVGVGYRFRPAFPPEG